MDGLEEVLYNKIRTDSMNNKICNFMKVVSTPFSGMLSSVAIKDCKETLAANIVEVDDK